MHDSYLRRRWVSDLVAHHATQASPLQVLLVNLGSQHVDMPHPPTNTKGLTASEYATHIQGLIDSEYATPTHERKRVNNI